MRRLNYMGIYMYIYSRHVMRHICRLRHTHTHYIHFVLTLAVSNTHTERERTTSTVNVIPRFDINVNTWNEMVV